MVFDPENSIQILAITGIKDGKSKSEQFERTIFNTNDWIAKDHSDNFRKIDLIPSLFVKMYFKDQIFGIITTQPKDFFEKNEMNLEAYKDAVILSISVLQSDCDYYVVDQLFDCLVEDGKGTFDYSIIEGYSGLTVSADKNLILGFQEGSWRKK